MDHKASSVVQTRHHYGYSFNGKAAAFISRAVLTMWTLWASILLMGAWIAGLGLTIAGDAYPYNLMLLAVGGIAQWLVMIALGVQGNVSAAAANARSQQQSQDVQTLLRAQAEIKALLERPSQGATP